MSLLDGAKLSAMPSRDPVHSEDGHWWFWDESWADRHGPFASEDEARRALSAYCDYLDYLDTGEVR